MVINFIERNEKGSLTVKRSEWYEFRDSLLSMAKNEREFEFIGQYIEDLVDEFEERKAEFEEKQ